MRLDDRTDRLRVAFVVPRYGLDVAGGAELYCRLLAEQCKDDFEIEILTTCAIDYVTWENEYRAGDDLINGILVKRFRVDFERDTKKWNELWPKLAGESHTLSEEQAWMQAQGPFSSSLIDYVRRHRTDYAAFVFVTYLYATTYFCLPHVSDRALLLPAAHDELPIYLRIFDEVFSAPRKLMCLTPEEMAFIQKRFNCSMERLVLIGGGCEPRRTRVATAEFKAFDQELDPAGRTLIYMGRLDSAKGVKTLMEWFERLLLDERNIRLQLVLLGKGNLEIRKHPAIHTTGFVSEEFKYQAILRADIVVVPSAYESLSFAALEGWSVGKPLIVNGKSAVLRGHCERSNGGLWYHDYEEFRAALVWLLEHPEKARLMGAAGERYVKRRYTWEGTKECFRRVVGGLTEK